MTLFQIVGPTDEQAIEPEFKAAQTRHAGLSVTIEIQTNT